MRKVSSPRKRSEATSTGAGRADRETGAGLDRKGEAEGDQGGEGHMIVSEGFDLNVLLHKPRILFPVSATMHLST